MMHVGRRHTHRWLIAALLLVCGDLLAPQTVRAGCGHYVGMRIHPEGFEAIGFGLPGALSTRPEIPTTGVPNSPAAPCSGLRCSQDRPDPLPVVRVVPRIDLWGCLDLSVLTIRNPSSPFPIDDDRPSPLARAERLSRPPR